MKNLNITFMDKDFEKLEKAKKAFSKAMMAKGKGMQSWEDYIFHMCS